MEVDAPVLVPGTGCEPFIDPMETAFMLSAEGEMQKRYLHTSPELYLKRLLARVPEPLFFLGHVFRNGEITSSTYRIYVNGMVPPSCRTRASNYGL